ncbi:hypothetical protein LNP00_02070 [Fructobacillus sp. M158]|uniref:hypothetical protein n=1 Tax=Fructobacillus parabroussonetiae TaxID=2713174 RepID=UPI002009E872|nr:hypothetical protein [Fructobacillus parabroussonetiae]MCK8617156.1 hypothetical protein [Fructobacillus parabroussonetiae]
MTKLHEMKGIQVPEFTQEEFLKKITRDDLIDFVKMMDEQERWAEKYEKEHRF